MPVVARSAPPARACASRAPSPRTKTHHGALITRRPGVSSLLNAPIARGPARRGGADGVVVASALEGPPPKGRCPEKSVSEKKIYTFEDWEQHRDAARYLRHLLALRGSRIARALTCPVAWVCLVALLVGGYETTAETLPELNLPHLTVVYKPFEVMSFALSLLLVFRTDASYARWQEARQAWKSVLTDTRELMRLGAVHLGIEEALALQRWTSVFGWVLAAHLDPVGAEDEWVEAVTDILTERELRALLDVRVPNRPVFVLTVLTQVVATCSSKQASPVLEAVHAVLSSMEMTVGRCERILKTPIPLSYTRHTSRFLITFLTMLPFALWDETRWGLIPVCGVTTYFLLGIDEIGVQIEEPFSIMPLNVYAATIERDAFASIESAAVARSLLPGAGQEGWAPPSDGAAPLERRPLRNGYETE